MSLNTELLQGPDLTNSLVGVLLRFRQEPIAMMADIKSMYYQVRVPRSDVTFCASYGGQKGTLRKIQKTIACLCTFLVQFPLPAVQALLCEEQRKTIVT